MKKILKCILVLGITFTFSACSKQENQAKVEKESLGTEILAAFEKNKGCSNYHMTTFTNKKNFDVNIENSDSEQNMAGSVTFETEILNHRDGSIVDTREVTEYIYKKGSATMLYREHDGLDQYNIDFENLYFFDSAYRMIQEDVQNEKENGQTSESISVKQLDNGSKEYIVSEAYHYIVNTDGYLISYTDDYQGSNFTIDNFDSSVLDYTYSKL